MKFLDEWSEDLIWCPSQCYRHVEFCGSEYELYLRWRHGDPWTGNVIKTLGDWSDELFAANGEFFKDDDYKDAQKMIEKLAFKWLLTNEVPDGYAVLWDTEEM